MKCVSCEMEINPQWKHAIDANICPFCGKYILEEHLKNLLSSLGEVMDKLQEYPDQLNDWMLSNHSYIKTTSPELIQYVPEGAQEASSKVEDGFQKRKTEQDKKYTIKVKTDAGEEDVVVEQLQSEEKTNDFFKRAEAVKPSIEGFKNTAEKTEHFKRVAQQIKKAGSVSLTNEDGKGETISPEQLENVDEEAIAEYEASLSGGNIASALPNLDEDNDIPPALLAMAGKGGSSGKGMADLLKMQQQQDRARRSRENFESGDNRGKGGFSRS